jgi:hypothetical protein
MEFPEEEFEPEPDLQRPFSKKSKYRKLGWYDRVMGNLKRRLHGLTAGFRSHAFVYVAANALLIGLNATIAGGYPWAYFPAAGWAIGLLANYTALWNRRREVKQLAKVPNISEEAGRILRQYQRAVGAMAQHTAAFISVNAYLFGINLIVSPMFLWALFPLAGWSIGFVPHVMGNMAKRKMLKDKLTGLGVEIPDLRVGKVEIGSGRTGYVAEAYAIREKLLKELKMNKLLQERWGEIEPLLKTFVDQIEELDKKRTELDRITAGLSFNEIEKELETARQKYAHTSDNLLKKEYERSITQYENHLKAVADLAHHRELLDVRFKSAFHLLKQLELDTVRVMHVDTFSEPASLASLREKTAEMQVFLEDFKKGVDELENEL